MPALLSQVRVGEPQRHQGLAVFPLFVEAAAGVEYLLADEALAQESIVVEEVSEGGSVPNLLVENKGDLRVLFLEGEELIGAKQNRILNTSILVAAHSKVKVPVSCVEQGRWRYQSRRFGSSGSHSPSKLRYALKRSVNASLKEGEGHRSDQGEVWKEVGLLHAIFGTCSATGAMSDTFDALEEKVNTLRGAIKYVPGAVGIAVALGDKIVALDVFDKPSTCEKVWNRLLSGFCVDALAEGEKSEATADIAGVERLLSQANAAAWNKVEPVGEGEDLRAEFGDDHGSALTFGDELVHGSVLAAV